MKISSDFRAEARAALRGRWPLAVLAGFLAALLGGSLSSGVSTGSSFSPEEISENLSALPSDLAASLTAALTAGAFAVVGYCIVLLIVGGAAALGYARFNLNLIDGREANLGDLISHFHRLGTGFMMRLLTGIYTALWTMLFIIPGIIKSYSYAMTPYILCEHPEWSADEAITESRSLMDGNKFRLFCLEFSFIGWEILCSLPSTILVSAASAAFPYNPTGSLIAFLFAVPLCAGYLVLNPYREAARAAFYREISRRTATESAQQEEQEEKKEEENV